MITSKTQRAVIRLILSALLALGLAAAVCWAVNSPEGVAGSAIPVVRAVNRALSLVTGVLPFSLIETLLIAAVLGALLALVLLAVGLIRKKGRLKRLLRFFSSALLIAVCLAALFFNMYGVGYFSESIDVSLGLEVKERTTEELSEVTQHMADTAAEYAAKVERGDDLVMAESDFSEVSELCIAAYDSLAEKSDFFYPAGGQAKSVLNWYLMSSFGITGIYIPYTAECNVNADVTAAELPFTAAHEMAHRMGVAPENEANFAAYLVLRESESDILRYSAYYNAAVYCYNALYRADRAAAKEIKFTAAVAADMRADSEHYQKYAGPVREFATSVNNAYLQAMQQSSGTRSYGEVVDLIMADYFS